MTEREAYIALNMLGDIGPVRVRAAAELMGGIDAVWAADTRALASVQGIGERLAGRLVEARRGIDWESEIERAERDGARILTPADGEYPKRLSEIHDPPLALYVRGRLMCRDDRAIAIVGTRRATCYGRDCAERFGFGLAKAGLTVVSGLAEGIDTAAHQGAMKAGGRTVGVIAGGLDRFYPESNRGLAEKMAESGAVVTEYPYGRQPDRNTFPVRNRIVSGLSLGVLLVEAPRKSGAMITVRQAAEQGRNVFAVPGRIDSPGSQGPHDLVRDGVKLVVCVDDILEECGGLFPTGVGTATAPVARSVALSETERMLVAAIEDGVESVDGLIRATGMGAADVTSKLIGLEMKRMVRMRPGQRVELSRPATVA
ncbi:MAG: DNA-protecting protein DprA [Lentisphaerae bacterium]|nr:DNA-protecting protein DprA [Lentisphaerota bacterium]